MSLIFYAFNPRKYHIPLPILVKQNISSIVLNKAVIYLCCRIGPHFSS